MIHFIYHDFSSFYTLQYALVRQSKEKSDANIFSEHYFLCVCGYVDDGRERKKNHYTHFINFTSLRVIARTHGECMKRQGSVILRGEKRIFL